MPDPVRSLTWCMEHEFCCTLDDYLRRRSNISQWVCREGLGKHHENEDQIARLSLQLAGGDPIASQASLAQYQTSVQERFDRPLSNI